MVMSHRERKALALIKFGLIWRFRVFSRCTAHPLARMAFLVFESKEESHETASKV